MGGTRFIVAGSLVDGSGAKTRRNVFLKVERGIIKAIGLVSELPGGEVEVDDLSHCVILPPLVDCSVFLSRSPSINRLTIPSADPDTGKKVVMVRQHVSYCYAHGVLGVAVDDDAAALSGLSEKANDRDGIVCIRTSGIDFLKVAYSQDIDDTAPALQTSHEELVRILQQKEGKKAVVVANGQQQVAEALDAGCDAIEQGYGMGEENLLKLAEKEVLWIPSVLRARNGLDGAGSGGSVCCRFSQRYVAPGKPNPGAEAFWKKTLAEQLGQLRLARKLGVKTAIGTGAGSIGILHGESVVEEMKLFIKSGYTLEETICCASENGARFFGMANLGKLQVGRNATFLVARGSVKQLPRKLSFLEGIYIDGLPSVLYSKDPVKNK